MRRISGAYLMEHLGRNATNYFMYHWAGPVCPLPLTHQVQAAGFLIMINYIYNQMMYITRM